MATQRRELIVWAGNGLQLIHEEEKTMNEVEIVKIPRRQIGIRFLYTLLYLVVLEVLKLLVQVAVVLQFIYLLITGRYSEPLRNFSNKLATYLYRVIRYATLNENFRPFPFNELPSEMEKPEERVHFN